jgi:hypothetical protein
VSAIAYSRITSNAKQEDIMTRTLAIEKNITTLNQLQAKFNLRRTDDDQFFSEWFEGLSELTEKEKQSLDVIKQQYFYQRADGPLAEGAVKMVILSKLLDMAGFYDPPFRFLTETSVEIAVEDQDEILRGRIDALVVQEQLWVLVIESKRTTFDIDVALPQALAYMMANPNPQRPIFGLVTNGGHFIFIKLVQSQQPHYDLSDDFSLYRRHNQLYDVLQILKRIGQIITQP